MTYAEVLLACRDYRYVLVSGAQRSGTTIAAECLAADLELPCVREEAFGVGTVPGGSVADWWRLVLDAKPGVIQCPSMSAFLHHTPDVWAVVWMVRPVEEIRASEDRIAWDGAEVEQARYFVQDDGGCVASLKQLVWGGYQVGPLGDRALELDYHSLSTHRLWVPADRRAKFGPRQTRE